MHFEYLTVNITHFEAQKLKKINLYALILGKDEGLGLQECKGEVVKKILCFLTCMTIKVVSLQKVE